MKKILYYTERDMTNPELGINKKIRNQIETLRKWFEVDAVYRMEDKQLILEKNNSKKIKIADGMKRPYKVWGSYCLKKYLKKVKYDGSYIRYVFADGAFQGVLKELKKAGTKTIIEIPTYPYDAELKDCLENKVVLLLDKMYRSRMKNYVYRISTYSRDKEIYGIPAFQIVNGLVFDKVSLVEHDVTEDDQRKISMIAVADLASWHGYDRLLEGMGRYYQKGGQRQMHFYLVGSGKELEQYQKIVEKYDLSKKVTFCGSLYGEALDEVYNKANVAIECLGAHRKGLKLSSSLKSREYAAKGLPMITSVDIDVFPKGEYPYICHLKGEEKPVNIEKIIEFYDKIYSGNSYDEVAEQIRAYAKKLCDMEVAMKPIKDILSE